MPGSLFSFKLLTWRRFQYTNCLEFLFCLTNRRRMRQFLLSRHQVCSAGRFGGESYPNRLQCERKGHVSSCAAMSPKLSNFLLNLKTKWEQFLRPTNSAPKSTVQPHYFIWNIQKYYKFINHLKWTVFTSILEKYKLSWTQFIKNIWEHSTYFYASPP